MRLLCGMLACVVSAGLTASAQADDAIEVIKKAVQANGGKEKIEKYKAVEMKGTGTVTTNGMKLEYTGHWWMQYPGKYRIEIETEVNGMAFHIVNVVNGKEGWQKVGDMKTMKLPKVQLETVQTQMKVEHAGTLVPLLDKKKYSVSSVGEVKVKGKKAIGLNVTDKSGLDVNFYFDPKTYMLIKEEYQSKDETGKEVTQTVFLSGYKEKDGVPFPTKIEVQHDGKTFVTAEFSEVKVHKSIDDEQFAKPE
ncbi:MAG: hypothetical protein ACE5KM_16080 [Planctomycetaceae bacterium]